MAPERVKLIWLVFVAACLTLCQIKIAFGKLNCQLYLFYSFNRCLSVLHVKAKFTHGKNRLAISHRLHISENVEMSMECNGHLYT